MYDNNEQFVFEITCIYMFLNNHSLYFIFMPYIANITVQHEGCILPISTTFELLTNYSSRLSSLCKQKRNVLINDLDFLTKHIHFEIVFLPNTIP